MNDSNISESLQIHTAACRRLTDWSHAIPSRGHWRMYWNLQGGAEVQYDGRCFPLIPERAVLIPPDTPIGRRLDNPAESFYVHFSLGLPYDLLAGKVYSIPTTPLEVYLTSVLTAFKDEAREPRKFPQSAVLSLNAIIFGLTARIPENDWPRAPRDSRIRAIMQVMERHLEDPLDNSALADRINMSVNAFIRKFSRGVGKAPQLYYLERRLLHSANLLEHTRQSIEEITAACGFCERSYFSRRFKAYFGTSPAAYRKR